MTEIYVLLINNEKLEYIRWLITNVWNECSPHLEAVAIDVSLEELMVWGYRAKLIHTHILTLGSVKANAHHAPRK